MFQGWKQSLLILTIGTVVNGTYHTAMAEEDLDLESIEAEMSRRGEAEAEAKPIKDEPAPEPKPIAIKTKDLKLLTAFSDVAVIQKKYMPKSLRFQLTGGIDLLTNNPFFDSYGANGRFAFFFTESVGVEFNYWKHKVAPRAVTTQLELKHNITTKTMLSSLGYMGGSLMFVPFYGKVSLLDRTIIPFDFYLSLGGGITETSYVDKEAPSFHVGIGEIFSINQSLAWRWDLSQVRYKARVPEADGSDSGKEQEMSDLYLGIGMTLLFPGVKHR